MLGIIRKRKFQAEQLESPIPKHKCWERHTVSDVPVSIEWLRLNGETKGLAIDHDDNNVSEPESMKDSNSYAEDSVSSTSILSEAKYAKTTVDGINSFSHSSSTSDDSTAMKVVRSGKEEEDEEEEETAATQGFIDLQEQLLEFGSHAEYVDGKSIEECTDKDLQGFLCAKGMNSDVYVLSSGRWSVNEGTSITPQNLMDL